MALDFPDSPSNGDHYNGFVYNSTSGTWKIGGLGTLDLTGGTEVTSGGFKYHTFTNDGTLTVTGSGLVECLIVAGGGGGGNRGTDIPGGGGGGAGGLIHTALVLSTGAYPIVIGEGGAGAIDTTTAAVNGEDSTGFGLTAIGGGAGGSGSAVGSAGASGGGGGGSTSGNRDGGLGMAGQGMSGGSGKYSTTTTYQSGGGGGGFGGFGLSQGYSDFELFRTTPNSLVNTAAGAGGPGYAGVSAWGLATSTGELVGGTYYYAGGGGGSTRTTGTQGLGGYGGGGAGVTGGDPANNGDANTGGGGGGAKSSDAGSGGSGIVIVRYAV